MQHTRYVYFPHLVAARTVPLNVKKPILNEPCSPKCCLTLTVIKNLLTRWTWKKNKWGIEEGPYKLSNIIFSCSWHWCSSCVSQMGVMCPHHCSGIKISGVIHPLTKLNFKTNLPWASPHLCTLCSVAGGFLVFRACVCPLDSKWLLHQRTNSYIEKQRNTPVSVWSTIG